MQLQRLDLSGAWSLCGHDGYGQLIGEQTLPAGFDNLLAIDAAVPGSVYLDLTRAGWIEDVHAGCNTLAAEWVERFYWYYRRRFDVPRAWRGGRIWLVFESLDLDAVIYVNGRIVGEHHNVYRPCRLEVTDLVGEGDNELIVRLNSGVLAAADKRGGKYNQEVTAVHTKRAHLRKPQYACRWDWSPRLMNVGIGGPVRLEAGDVARLDQFVITPELADDLSAARLGVRAVVENVGGKPRPLTLRARVEGSEAAGEVEGMVAAGRGELVVQLSMAAPRLWWPRTQGAPHLYDVDVELWAGDERIDGCRRQTGIRRVELRQDPDPAGGRFFQLLVNGERIFCLGANWVPADLLYPRVTGRDYDELVALLAECGGNMLRVWGGGHYEDHAFFAACDRAGIMVWQDLMFACTQYPGDDPAFCGEAEAEVRHNVRELAYHPSLVLWCGNNEIEVGVRDGWIGSDEPGASPDQALFHEVFARAVEEEDGSRPYWPSSPWSPDGGHPNDQRIGDQHPWQVALGEAKGDYGKYREDASRFPNEGGMLGASPMKTLQQILPAGERRVGSRTWLHHDNTQGTWRGEPMIDNLLRVNLCDRPRALSFEDYVRYSGILQGEALETGIDNWRRRKFDSAAAIFWMFNDTWPAVTSWTVIDYYRRRKPAFWYVKRAFAGLRAICVESGAELAVVVVNDARKPRMASVRYGLFALGGGRPVDESVRLECPANGAVVAARLPLSGWDKLGVAEHGAFAVLSADDGAGSTHRLFRARFRDLAWAPARVTCTPGPDGLRLRSDTFAWAVCLDEDGESALADNYFDLVPGIERIVPWSKSVDLPGEVQAANPGWEING